MDRHVYIQMSKLSNVRGRISYISSTAKQENLYAVYETCDRPFWSKMAKENRADYIRSGTAGDCIEARELIIALPESFVEYDPQELLKEFTEFFKDRYGVECIAALHHNKKKTNYHIHLIFSERKTLAEPKRKVASRNMFYDENGRHCRTKREILDDDGNVRAGCNIVKKGEIYEEHLFDKKIATFKDKSFTREIKEAYTELINERINDENERLKVFNKDGIYLPLKKIGKNNPNEKNIRANNRMVLEWNNVTLQAVELIPAEHIREVKKEEIQRPMTAIYKSGTQLGDLYEKIVDRAVTTLVNFVNRWLMLSKEQRPKPGEDFFYRLLEKCRPRVRNRFEWDRDER